MSVEQQSFQFFTDEDLGRFDSIKDCYRSKVKEVHPDLGGDSEQFIQLKEEYQTVKNNNFVSNSEIRFSDHRNFSREAREINIETFSNNVEECISISSLHRDPLLDEQIQSFLQDNKMSQTHNQAYYIINNKTTSPTDPVLDQTLLSEGYRLSYLGSPTASKVNVIYNVSDECLIDTGFVPGYMRNFRRL